MHSDSARAKAAIITDLASQEPGNTLLKALWLLCVCVLLQWESTGRFGLHLALIDVASLVSQGLYWEKSASPAAQGISEGDGSAPAARQ